MQMYEEVLEEGEQIGGTAEDEGCCAGSGPCIARSIGHCGRDTGRNFAIFDTTASLAEVRRSIEAKRIAF